VYFYIYIIYTYIISMMDSPLPVPSPIVADTSDSSSSVMALAPTNPNITKDQLKEYLRQWVRVENEIGTLSAEIKKRKLIHQQLSASLLNVMRQNEIDCFDLANGRIVYSKTKTKAPLNNGQLKSALTTYYKDDVEKAANLTEFLLSSRVEKTRESIKMKIPKNK
jgi:tRNA A-37 threonylcarbamoyl transferase component Bud32